MNNPRCYLLDIAPELRLQIYAGLLAPEKVEIWSYSEPTLDGLSDSEIATTRFRAHVPRSTKTIHPDILCTCRQIYHEAEPAALSTLHPVPFASGVATRRPFGEMKNLGTRTFQRFRKLHSIPTSRQIATSAFVFLHLGQFYHAAFGVPEQSLEPGHVRQASHRRDDRYRREQGLRYLSPHGGPRLQGRERTSPHYGDNGDSSLGENDLEETRRGRVGRVMRRSVTFRRGGAEMLVSPSRARYFLCLV